MDEKMNQQNLKIFLKTETEKAMAVMRIVEPMLNELEFGTFMATISTMFHSRCIREGLDIKGMAQFMHNNIKEVADEEDKKQD